MNIKQAKEYIKQTVSIYLKKDEFDEYEIPVVRQRPIFLLGAPGLGKTAIMEQIAGELGIALVSYAMTHHTRQSAIGLPVIKHKNYDGLETDITEYTMSEIIASMYETMEKSDIKEGILFLDEINCVSETLAPSMLNFLQYKEFGNRRIPEGWVVVTAGNPPEFNKAVREFDVAVMDRMKVLEVTADYGVFREYADERNLHPAIISFLDSKKEFFYRIENTVRGRSYVTARGWEDLSDIILKYESEGFEVDENLIGQYLRNTEVVKEFSAYYDLFKKYRKDYGISNILKGEYGEDTLLRARNAAFDERLSVVSMLIDNITRDMREQVVLTDCLSDIMPVLKAVSDIMAKEDNKKTLEEILSDMTEVKRGQLLKLNNSGALLKDENKSIRYGIKLLEEARKRVLSENGGFEIVKEIYNGRLSSMKDNTAAINTRLHNALTFTDKAFEGGNELLIFVSNLTANNYSSVYLSRFPSEDYDKYHKELMMDEKKNDIERKIGELI